MSSKKIRIEIYTKKIQNQWLVIWQPWTVDPGLYAYRTWGTRNVSSIFLVK